MAKSDKTSKPSKSKIPHQMNVFLNVGEASIDVSIKNKLKKNTRTELNDEIVYQSECKQFVLFVVDSKTGKADSYCFSEVDRAFISMATFSTVKKPSYTI